MISKGIQCLILACTCVCLVVWRIILLNNTSWFVNVLLLFVTGISLDIYRLKPSPFHTYKTLLQQYAIFKIIYIIGTISKKRFDDSCFNVKQSQEKILKKILANNASSSFSKDHNLDKVKNIAEFRKTIPLTKYDIYLPYISRAMQGESNIFFPQKIDYVATTTGTTSGKSKLFLKSSSLSKTIFIETSALSVYGSMKAPGLQYLRFFVWTGSSSSESVSDTGLRMGPTSTLNKVSDMPYMTSPLAADKVRNDDHKGYIDLLFGLRDDSVTLLYTFLSPALLAMFKSLERHWRALCDDIERGTLYSGIAIDKDIRTELESLCRPDPIRAVKLREEFRKGFDGIVPRIWPDCKLVLALSTGSFRVYSEIVQEKYLGGVLLLSQAHGGTEGTYGVNIWPEWKEHVYAPLPSGVFYEWLPLDDDTREPVLTHEVELGKEYELVVTTIDGLYRYRTEDIVKFTKRYYHLPMYEFVCRKGELLHLAHGKVSESLASQALLESIAKLDGSPVVDYTFVESVYYEQAIAKLTGKLYYVIFVEVDGEEIRLEEITRQVDEKLRKEVKFYETGREKGSFQAPKILHVQTGTFSRFKAQRLASNKMSTSAQYKVPRILRQDDMIVFFESSRVELCPVD